MHKMKIKFRDSMSPTPHLFHVNETTYSRTQSQIFRGHALMQIVESGETEN
jgi:hypothetical protein